MRNMLNYDLETERSNLILDALEDAKQREDGTDEPVTADEGSDHAEV
jgi:hypothetical protein